MVQVSGAAGAALAMVVAHGGQTLPVSPALHGALTSRAFVSRGVSVDGTASAHAAVANALFSIAVHTSGGGDAGVGGLVGGSGPPASVTAYSALAVALHAVPSTQACAVLFRDLFR